MKTATVETEAPQTRTFLEYLTEHRYLTAEQAQLIKQEVVSGTPEFQRDILFRSGLLTEETSYVALADFYGCPFIDLRHVVFDPKAVAKLSADMAHQYQAVPFYLLDNELSVAMAVYDPEILESIEHSAGCRINPYIAPLSCVLEAIDIQYFDIEHQSHEVRVEGLHSDARGENDEMRQLSNTLIATAIKERASDIHIEPEDGFVRIRFRVDGILREERRLPLELHHHLVTRLKVMASLDISENRRPQDGRIRVLIGQRSFDIRMSVVPSKGSEKVVLRILDRTGLTLDLDHLFLSESIQRRVKKVIQVTSGLILVTGPTGSGKTTFCYSVINKLNTLERNIITIEDPVEYRFPIVTQIQINSDIGISFACILRSVLRQDPNVIFVGEIRDLETARVVTEAALTGHLVLSTMHTNNAVQAVIRMVEIGVEPFMVAPSIESVLSQRLVRRICPHCSVTYVPGEEERELFRLMPEDDEKLALFRGCGCDVCHGTGYFGRLGIHELVMVTDEIRDMILKGTSMLELERAAARGGYRSMRYDGLKKALLGLTTVEEVQRVTLDREEMIS